MSELLKPPVVPSAILNFFASQPDFAAAIGDISEEFQQRVSSSGARSAKFWYWREVFRNALALTAREVLRTPIRTFLLAFGCFVAVNAVAISYCLAYLDLNPFRRLDELALDQNQRAILLLLQFITSLALGWMGGRLLPGREWALALMYALVSPWVAPVGFGLILVVWKAPGDLNPFLFQPVRVFLIWEITLRLGAFWLGCLWVRRSRSIQPRSLTHA